MKRFARLFKKAHSKRLEQFSIQLPPNLVAHVLRGGQIPGVPKESLDKIVQSFMTKMAEMANALQQGQQPKDIEKVREFT